MREEIKKWLKKAEEDLEVAKFNFKWNKLDVSAFYCQQAVEKVLKALFIKRFKKLIRTHDLKLLAVRLNAPRKISDRCSELSRAYVVTRYPDIEEVYEKEDVEKFLETVSVVMKWVGKKMRTKK
jgi:HEPN domain-containing protein